MPLSAINEIGLKHWWISQQFISRDLTPAARMGHIVHSTNATTGNLITRITLWNIAHRVGRSAGSTTSGIVPFPIPPTLIALFHNSRDSLSGGPFGTGWSWPLDESITEEGGTLNCVHRDGSGAEYFYTSIGSGQFTSPASMPTRLVKQGGQWYLLDMHAHTLRTFNTAGKIIEFADANRNLYRIKRDGSNLITSVVNVRSDGTEGTIADDFIYTTGKLTQFGLKAAAVKFTLAYTSGKLTTITLNDGTTIGLAYTGDKVNT
ncbi:MAG: DUF6531 domain-containing protein, partial [bacterium]